LYKGGHFTPGSTTMNWIIKIIGALIPELIIKLLKRTPPTMEVGESGGKLEKSVKDQIDDDIPNGPGGKK